MFRRIVLGWALGWLSVGWAWGEEPIGKRPYEMVWANRETDTQTPLVDFENLDGWTVALTNAEATLTRSQRQQLWGKYVGELVYRGLKGKRPKVVLTPAQPIPVKAPFDCVNLWAYGNNWGYSPDPKTPAVEIAVLLANPKGDQVRVVLGHVNWTEWWLMHRRLTPEQLALVKDGVSVTGIEISGGSNPEDRRLFFDNLTLYTESLPPLEFDKRPIRPFDPCPDGTPGLNVGPEKLPFPTRVETILPDNLTSDFKNEIERAEAAFLFHYRGKDGHLVYRYLPASGTLGDLTAQWEGGEAFKPMADGGVRFFAEEKKQAITPEKCELVRCQQNGNAVESAWRCTVGARTAEVTYRLELLQKSMLITVRCPGGEIGEFCTGKAVGLSNPRLVTLPYLAGDWSARPAVVVAGPAEKPLFASAFVDYYMSNASALWAQNTVAKEGVVYNGGTRYLPKTDGRRNTCFERIFLTVSPQFAEMLPNLANLKSPWMHETGQRVWIAYGAHKRESDYEHWKRIARYGMSKILVTDHETGWRDGGESFTFRTRAAPGKGGDEGQAEYSRKMHELGFRYGIYNNYTDYAPVNEHWHADRVTRTPENQWRGAWMRCYNPKPARAVEYEAKLTPVIQEKFHLDTAYCDVHTAVTPWAYVDFDARVPRAGTFAATFYAYGEIMLHQKKVWNGPVYSEGNNHWYYCGLTDGNYGQDGAAHLATSPWLVDFDLKKLHPLCCNFGMGNPEMFYGSHQNLGKTPEEREPRLDRFLAATLAFGHTGFLVLEGGIANTVRSYFSLQQVHTAYAQEKAVEIRYADAQGRLFDTSAAVATDAFRRSQIVTRYSNGMVVTVNGHPTENWKIPQMLLPPNGWYVEKTQGDKLLAWSGMVDGHRTDYVDSPAYLYANGRGRLTRFPKMACDGQLIAHRRADGSMEVIPVAPCKTFAVSLDGRTGTAVALAEDGKELGPAETRLARGLVHILPVPKAFSYLVKTGAAAASELACTRENVVPGETVSVVGASTHAYQVPANAAIDSHVWQQFEDRWIDFHVAPLVDATLRVDDAFHLDVTSNLTSPIEAELKLAGQSQRVTLVPGQSASVSFAFERPTREEVRQTPLQVTAGTLRYERIWWLAAQERILPLAAFPEAAAEKGQRLRKEKERDLDTTTGANVHWQKTTCDGVAKDSWFMHPPYKKGVGYAFAQSEPIALPAHLPAALRGEIGKADGSDPGDGILFRMAVIEPNGQETVVAEKTWIEHAWTPLEADLSRFAGQKVRVKLIADVGPKDNSSGDWAAWSNVRVESLRPTLVFTMHEKRIDLKKKSGK